MLLALVFGTSPLLPPREARRANTPESGRFFQLSSPLVASIVIRAIRAVRGLFGFLGAPL
jgi:hypothetical protein